MSAWTDRPGTSVHVDGHRVGHFPEAGGWFLYPALWPVLEAQGPFRTREAAKDRCDPANFQAAQTPLLLPVAPRFSRQVI